MNPHQHGSTQASGSDRVSIPRKIAYGAGAVAENTMQNAVGNMANPFFNVALGVSPGLLGIAASLFRLWDAITDPLMGTISDRTRSKFGRRRPYIVIGAVLGGFLFAAMWWCPRGMDPGFYFAWYLVVSVVFYTAFTIFGVPFLALGYELSSDYHERTRVMAFRTWFASVGGIAIQWIYWLTQRDIFEDTVDGMRWVAIGIGLMILIMGAIPGLFLKERQLTAAEVASNQKNIRFRTMLAVFRVKPFRQILACLVFSVLGMFLVIIFGFYINVYYVFGGDQKAASTIIGVSGTFYHLCCMVSIPIIAWTSSRIGKKKTLLVFIAICIAASCGKWWLFTPANPWLQLVAIGLMAPGMSAIWTLLASMTADVTDLDELENGTRREGSFGAFYGWTMKLGFSVCFLVSGFMLEWTGFDASLGGAQSESTLTLMRLLYTIIPMIGLLVAMASIARFPINEQRAHEMRVAIEARSPNPR